MPDETTAQQEWIERVLGVSFAPFPLEDEADEIGLTDEDITEENTPPKPLHEIYEDAKDHVAAAINVFGKVLKLQPSPLARRIADYGLLALTDGEHVALTRSLLAYQAASDESRSSAAGQVRDAVAAYRQKLNEPVFRKLDDNPFKLEIGWTTTLDRALERIAASLA